MHIPKRSNTRVNVWWHNQWYWSVSVPLIGALLIWIIGRNGVAITIFHQNVVFCFGEDDDLQSTESTKYSIYYSFLAWRVIRSNPDVFTVAYGKVERLNSDQKVKLHESLVGGVVLMDLIIVIINTYTLHMNMSEQLINAVLTVPLWIEWAASWAINAIRCFTPTWLSLLHQSHRNSQLYSHTWGQWFPLNDFGQVKDHYLTQRSYIWKFYFRFGYNG